MGKLFPSAMTKGSTASACALTATTGLGLWRIFDLQGTPLDGLTHDGFRYLAGAISLREARGYLDVSGTAQTAWPPGTSLLYACLSALSGKAPEALITVVNLIFYLIATVGLWFLLRRLKSAWLVALAASAFAVNSFVLSMTNKLWSDLIATALLTCCLAVLSEAEREHRGPAMFVSACALASAAMTFRFAMLAAVPLLLLVAFAPRTRQSSLIRVLAALVSPVPTLLLMHIVSAAPHTPARVMIDTRWPDLAQAGEALTSVAHQLIPTQLGWGATIIFVALLTYAPFGGLTTRGPSEARARIIVISGAWILCYSSFILVAMSVWAHPAPTVDLRMLIPMYPACLALLAAAADALLQSGRRAAAGLIAAVLVLGVLRAFHALPARPAPPQQCISRDQIVRSLKQLRVDHHPSPVETNAPGLVWYALRRPAVPPATPGFTSGGLFVDERACEGAIEVAAPAERGTLIATAPGVRQYMPVQAKVRVDD